MRTLKSSDTYPTQPSQTVRELGMKPSPSSKASVPSILPYENEKRLLICCCIRRKNQNEARFPTLSRGAEVRKVELAPRKLFSSCRPGAVGIREAEEASERQRRLAGPLTVFQGSHPCCSSFATSSGTPVTGPGWPSSLPTRSVLPSQT